MKKACTTKTKNKLIVFQENRSKLTISNKKQEEVEKINVDGREITTGIRCDYLLLTDAFEYFIELKGQDLDHAIEQLKTTISKLSSDPKKGKKKSFIICTRSPLNSASIQNLQFKFRKHFNSELIIKSSPLTYSM